MPITIDQIITQVKKNYPQSDTDMLQLAYDFASKAHDGQKRKSGEPYIQHCLGTALTLQGPQPFVVRSVRYPDGNEAQMPDWVLPGETFRFVPAVGGGYTFLVGTKEGRRREMTTKVVKCGG